MATAASGYNKNLENEMNSESTWLRPAFSWKAISLNSRARAH